MAQSFDSYEERKGLTFAQAEGAELLPSQLQRDHLTERLRAKLWSYIYRNIDLKDGMFGPRSHWWDWYFLSRSLWVDYFQKMVDDFPDEEDIFLGEIKQIFKKGSYLEVLDFYNA